MIPIAAAFSLLAIAASYTALRQERNTSGNSTNVLCISLSSTLLITCWLFATSSYSTALSSQLLNPVVWQRFFLSGTSFSEILSIQPTTAPTTASTGACNVSLEFGNNGGLLFLSIATPLAFVLSWIILCTRCCGGGLEERSYLDSRHHAPVGAQPQQPRAGEPSVAFYYV